MARDQQRVKLLNHEHEQIETRVRELDPAPQEIKEQLEVCFAAGKYDLARALIRRRLEAQRRKQFLERKRGILQDTLAGLGARIGEQQAQLDATGQKADLLAESRGSRRRARFAG